MKWWTPSKVTAMEKSSQGMFRVCQKRNFYLELDTSKRTSSPVVSSLENKVYFQVEMVYDFLIVVVFLVLCYISSYHLSGHAWDRQMDSQLSRNESQVKVIPLESPSSCDWQLLRPFGIFSMWLMIAPALSDTRGEKLGSCGWAHVCNAGRGYLQSWKSRLMTMP